MIRYLRLILLVLLGLSLLTVALANRLITSGVPVVFTETPFIGTGDAAPPH